MCSAKQWTSCSLLDGQSDQGWQPDTAANTPLGDSQSWQRVKSYRHTGQGQMPLHGFVA